MFREISKPRQIAGEFPRRWYSCDNMDLFVWFGDDGLPFSFQLSYDKNADEGLFAWHPDRGGSHYLVDDSDRLSPLKPPATPILLQRDGFPYERVVREFSSMAKNLPESVSSFVAERISHGDSLRAHASPATKDTPGPG